MKQQEPMAHDPLGASGMARRIRAHDWAATPLGPIDSWPERTRAVVELVLASPLVSTVALLDDRLLIYNDAAALLYGDRHPGALGRPLASSFPDSYPVISSLYDRVFAGESVQVAGQALPVSGPGGGEIFDAYLSPVRDAAGAVVGAHMVGLEIGARLRAQAALEESEARYRTLFGEIDSGFCIIDMIFGEDGRATDYRFVQANPAFERQSGLVGAVGRRINELAPNVEEHWFERYGRVALTGEPMRIEGKVAPLGRWFDINAFRVGAPEQRRVGVLFTDITARQDAENVLRDSEARQTFMLRLSDALRPLAAAREIADAACRLLVEQLSASQAQYAEIRGESQQEQGKLRGQHAGSSQPFPSHFPLAPFGEPILETLRASDTLVIIDIDHDSRLDEAQRGAFHAVGASAVISVPLVKNGQWTAAFTIQQGKPRDWSSHDIRLAEDVAERTWDAIERARAEAALRDSEARLAAAFESVPVGAAVIDKAGESLLSNAQYRRFLPNGLIPSRDPVRGARWRAWDEAGKPLEPQNFPGARALRGETIVPGQEMLYTDDEGNEVWTNVATAPTRDDKGQVTGAVTAIADVTEAKRAADALRESEERLRQFGELSQDVLWIRDAETFQWEYLTPAFETIYGMTRESALRGDNMTGWLELILPEDRDHAARSLGRVRDGEWVTFQFRFRRPSDGEIRYMRNTDFPIRDATGKVVRIGGIGHDITPLKEVEQALTVAEQRQRALIEGIPQLVWRAVDGGQWTWASPQWTAFTGQTDADSHGHGWLDPVHPDDREGVCAIWMGAIERGEFHADYRIRHQETGRYHWFQTRATPVRDEDGAIVEWLGTSTDVDDLRGLQERQQILLAELQHRVRNILAIIRSIMRRSLDGEQSLQDYAQHLEGRVAALARTQVLLTRQVNADVDLEELIRDELTAQAADDSQIEITGPDVDLPPKAAEVLALAMHELATNSVKYGALAHPEAGLRIAWAFEDRDDNRWLVLNWSELGVALSAQPPARIGFGTELITRRVPYELKGHGDLAIKPGGIECTIAFPLINRASILETGSAPHTGGQP